MNIIYGASIIGKIVLQSCRTRGVPIDYFCDESPDKIGDIEDIRVVHPSEITNPLAHFIIAVINIKDIIKKLSKYSWETSLPYIADFSTTDTFIQGVIGRCRFAHEAIEQPDKLIINNVDLVITERCSLKCKDCANLMQYYTKPHHLDISLLYDTIDRFCDMVDKIGEFRVIGGETFINPNHHLIIEKVLSKPNIDYIIAYTNGTINLSPSVLHYYQNPRVVVSVTDYGPNLSKRLPELIASLDKYNIKYYVSTFDGWFDCANILPHTNVNRFDDCCAKDLLTLLYGKLYKCPFSAHAINLNLIPAYNQDYVDIFHIDRNELKVFIDDIVPESCCHCRGRIYSMPKITPAIQLNGK